MPREEKWIPAPLHHCLSGREAHQRERGTRRGCGKKENSWRLVEVDKTYIFNFCQKVFDGGLGKKMNSSCHET